MAVVELIDLPTNFKTPLPEFNSDGLLTLGDYAPTKAEFVKRFVETGSRKERKRIFNGWNRHRVELMEYGISASDRQLLDGSYTTNKADPGDIDLVVEVKVQAIDAIASHPALGLLQGAQMKERYECDAYPLFVLPRDDVNHASVTVEAIRYWTKWFGTSRTGVPKGRIWVNTGGLV